MYIAGPALNALEKRLPKVIDARTHGVIDYCHAAFFLTLGFALSRRNPRASLASFLTGGFVLVQSLLTDYPLGATSTISFETHGKLDAGFAALSPLMPAMFGFSGTPAARVFQANAVVEGSVAATTNFDSTLAHRARHRSR